MTTFDELWEQEERFGLQQRLQSEYPAWKRRRRTVLTTMASIAVVAAVAIPAIHQALPDKHYDSVACNRSGIAEDYWATMASTILTKETL